MQSALKQYAASGTAALLGAGVILSVPMVQRAEIELPALRAPIVELTAVPEWLEDLTALTNTAIADLAGIAIDEIENPAPFLSQVIANQIANGQEVAIGGVEGLTALAQAINTAPLLTATLVNLAITDPEELPEALSMVIAYLAGLPDAILGPALVAFDTALDDTVINAVAVFEELGEELPGLIDNLIAAPLAIAGTALIASINVAEVALEDPLSLPDAIGEGVYEVAATTVDQATVIIENVGDIREDLVDVITPTEVASVAAIEPEETRPGILLLRERQAAAERGVRVVRQIGESSAAVGTVVLTASGEVVSEVVEAGVEVGSAVLSGDRLAVREAVLSGRAEINAAVDEGSVAIGDAVEDAGSDIGGVIRGDDDEPEETE